MEILKSINDYVVLYYIYDEIHSIDITKNKETIAFIEWKVNVEEKKLYNFYVYIEKNWRNISDIHNLMIDSFNIVYQKQFKDFNFEYIYLDQRFKNLIERKVRYNKLPTKILENYITETEKEKKKIFQSELKKLETKLEKLDSKIMLFHLDFSKNK